MGNIIFGDTVKSIMVPNRVFQSPETFVFHDAFNERTNNGLFLNCVYLPEEVIMHILSFIPPKELLAVSAVCKKWCDIIKSDIFWVELYLRRYNKKPKKKLPWYTYYALFTTPYFNNNLIKNGNGENQFQHWEIVKNYGDQFRVEDRPCGANPLPENIPEFNGKTSCFATSYYECNKRQEISFQKSRLMQFILSKHKPHIYVSEWMAGRFDCGCVYHLWCLLYGNRGNKNGTASADYEDEMHYSSEEDSEEPLLEKCESKRVEQWQGKKWSKVEMVIKDYPKGVKRMVFQHEGSDTQFWKGHYGSKMAGGVLRILFDSLIE